MKAQDAIQRMERRPEVIDASHTVRAAIRQMLDPRVRALIVTDNDRLVGIVEPENVFLRLVEIGGAALDEDVAELIVEEAVTVSPDALLDDVAKVFQERCVNHVVVVNGEAVEGILTSTDVMARLLDHVEFLNEHLRDYVSTTGYSPTPH